MESTEFTTNNKNKAWVALAVLVAIVIIVAGGKALTSKKAQGDSVATTNSDSSPTTSTASGTHSTQTYKDGDYTATSSYDSPAGTESIKLSITLKGNAITATNAVSEADDPTAAQFQSDFIDGYKTLVVGKNINSVSLSRVSGSSLTSQGFNAALNKIKSQAAA